MQANKEGLRDVPFPVFSGHGMIVYGSMDRQALDAAYNNSAAVADSDRYLADWLRRSEALRARMPDHLNLVYSDAPRARLDFFATNRADAATLLFFHGGYWQRNAKEGFSFVAEGPLALGFHVAVAGYTLAPEATMDRIVREARTALHWLHEHLAALGGHPGCIYISGWSAGGHLATMLMDEPLVAGGLAISGLFDLEPIRLCYLNEKLGLDTEEARRNSPLLNLPTRAAKLLIAYGSEELPELKRQSREFGAACMAHGLPGEMIEVADCHHYAVLEQLARPDGVLAKALAVCAGINPA
jgi:acetyl esterase/lipase